MNSHNTSFLSFLSSSAFSTFIKLLARESFFSSSLFNLESRSREFLFSSQLSFIEISSDEESIIESSNDDELESFQFTFRASLTFHFTFHAFLTFQLTSCAFLTSQFTFRVFNTFFVSFFELQRISTQMKTTYIINEMRKIKFFFNDMFEKIINSSSHKNMKNNLLNKLQFLKKRNVLNIIIDECANIDQKHRAEFSSLTKHDLFRAWTFENMTNQRHVIFKNMMKIIEKRVSTLINYLKSVVAFERIRLSDFVFQVIMKLISNDSSSLWINIFFMLCYIYRFRTCTRWSTLMNVQLHSFDIKRRVIEVLIKTEVCVEYKKRVLIFWHHFGYLNTTLRLDWHPLAETGKNLSLTSSFAPIRASTCCKRARISEKRFITTQLRRPPTCADHPPALTTQLRWSPTCVDHPAALITHLRKKVYYHSAAPTIHLRRSPTCADHPAAPTTQLRRPPSCVDHPAALTTHLRKKVYYHSAAPTTHLRRPEKAVPIQPSRKSRPHSTQPKKPFLFNSGKKAVPI